MSTKGNEIPAAIMERIKRRAEALWEDDADMLNDTPDDEIEAYQELHAIEIENVPFSTVRGG